ncbi:MAG: fibronectin type III domain-containing protein [Thermoplasmatota archaeon]
MIKGHLPCLTAVLTILLLIPSSYLIAPGGDSIITRVGEPGPPGNLQVTVGNKIVRLRWEKPVDIGDSNLTDYHVYKGDSIGSIEIYRTLHPEVLFYNDTSVQNTNTYYYYVRAENSQGMSGPSNTVEATPVGPPSAPLNFQLTSGDGEAHLSWDTPENNGGAPVQGYKVIRGSDAFSLTEIAELGVVLQYTDAGLKNGALYYYAVFAFNEMGDSPKSEIKNTMPTGPPGIPTNLSADGSDGLVTVSWKRPADNGGKPILGYHLYRGMSNDNLSMYMDLEPSENYTDSNVTNGFVYYYGVLSYNMVGPGEMSVIVSALPVGVPGRPVDLTAIPGNKRVFLNWGPPANDGGSIVTEYEVQRITKNDAPVRFNVGGEMEFTDEDLENGKTYYYSVRAYNAIGSGPFTEQITIKPESPPPEPRNFYIQEDDGEIRLYWSPPDYISDYPITEFLIYRSVRSGGYELLINLTSDTYSYTDKGLNNGDSYGYRIGSRSFIGNGSLTEEMIGVPFGMPGPPRSFNVDPGNGEVVLTWAEPLNSGGRPLTGYRIYRGLSSGDLSFLASTDQNATSYIDDSVQNGIVYYYRILAMNSEVDGNRTEILEAMPVGEPGEPLNLRITETDGVVILQWDPPVDNCGCPVERYIIYRGLSRDTMVEYDTSTNTTYTDNDLNRGTYYYYSVSAVNSVGNGSVMEPEVVRISDKAEEESGINPVIFIIIGAVLIIVILMIVIIAVFFKKRPSGSGQEGVEEEESDDEAVSPESDIDLMIQRRREMEEISDVPLTVDQAHAHDHDEHHLTYEDLYGTKEEPKPPEVEE